MNSRRRGQGQGFRMGLAGVSVTPDGVMFGFRNRVGLKANVRFGSKADTCAAKSDVRFTPNSDVKANSRKRSCPLTLRKRTCAVQTTMSAMGQ
jgi:hypothetical protein